MRFYPGSPIFPEKTERGCGIADLRRNAGEGAAGLSIANCDWGKGSLAKPDSGYRKPESEDRVAESDDLLASRALGEKLAGAVGNFDFRLGEGGGR